MELATSNVELGWQARRTFMAEMDRSLDLLANRLQQHLLDRTSRLGAFEDAVGRRAAHSLFQQQRRVWLASARQGLARLAQDFEQARGLRPRSDSDFGAIDLPLADAEQVLDQVMASRAALAVLEQAGAAYRSLNEHLRRLENTATNATDAEDHDLLHPIKVARVIVQGWSAAGLSRELWLDCQVPLHQERALAMLSAYRAAEEWFIAAHDESGLLPLGGEQSVAKAGTRTETDDAAPLVDFLSESLPMTVAWLQSQPGEQPMEPEPPATPEAPAPAPAPIDWSGLAQGAANVRAQVWALKTWSPTTQERTVIELVALMFDAILSADRIPASLRLWLAKLQMPVLRTALADSSFLSSSQHPARLLIDRMGAAVLGFEAAVPPELLEQEVRQIVQVVEQYPDTGRQVFASMLRDFDHFLAQHPRPTSTPAPGEAVAQQVEHQHILTVQYTIELRKLMGDGEVRPAVREFLFQTWAEVMAHASLRFGEDDAKALAIRQVAHELLWAAQAKHTRQERAQVIARVPGLMESLRQGMALLGYSAERSEAEIKLLRVGLVDAFMTGPRQPGS